MTKQAVEVGVEVDRDWSGPGSWLVSVVATYPEDEGFTAEGVSVFRAESDAALPDVIRAALMEAETVRQGFRKVGEA